METYEKKMDAVENSCKVFKKIWHLGMNIDPADGHLFGYTVGKINRLITSAHPKSNCNSI
jgi:hypothetical protein